MTTMNNATIIFNESLKLMKAGTIGTTGRTITVEVIENGQPVKKAIQEPEPIHTFQDWKNRGYIVKKGEKAIAAFTIWNFHSHKKDDEEEEKSLMKNGYYYMKKAAFFKYSQVKPLNDPDDPKDPAPAAKPAPIPEVTEAPAPIMEAKPAKRTRKAAAPDTEKAYQFIEKSAVKNKFQYMKNGTRAGITYATDGHQLMKTTDTVEAPELDQQYSDSFEKMLKGLKPEKAAALDIDTKEIRAAIKDLKAGRRNAKIVYSNGDGLVINANYLLNAVIATGATEYRYTDHKSPVVFENDTTIYMLLPINYRNQPELEKGFHVIG